MGRHCLKGTSFMCPCDDCMAELQRKAYAHTEHLLNLKNNVAHYWTDAYSAKDKADTEAYVGAGHEYEPHCQCLRCQVARYPQAQEAQA